MSAAAPILILTGLSREPTRACDLPSVEAIATAISPIGVYFEVTTRIDTKLLNFWQRWGYELFCRRLPAPWSIPPIIPLVRGGFLTWERAVEACKSPNDQIHIRPLNWAYESDCIDVDMVCRPRDPDDAANYMRLKSLYGEPNRLANAVCSSCELQMKVKELEDRLSRVEEIIGSTPDNELEH